MTATRRTCPYPEWIEMYRRGISSANIAAVCGASEGKVRYHLRIAAQADVALKAEHAAAAGPKGRILSAGLKNLKDILAFFEAHGRLPSTSSASARERALGTWLIRRRQEFHDQKLSAVYEEGLSTIPGWSNTRKSHNERRWNERLEETVAYRAAGNDWPRHKGTSSEQERLLGLWLHRQRVQHRRDKLGETKESRLDKALPGWRKGRALAGGRVAGPEQTPALKGPKRDTN